MNVTCPYASSGCNAPESECIGLCMPRPKAELHPIIAAALAPFAPPPPRSPCPTVDVCRHVGCHSACDRRTPEEEARWVAADLARVREENRTDAEERRADHIQRRDADLECAMSGCYLPGRPL